MKNLKCLTDTSIVCNWCYQDGNPLSDNDKSMFEAFMEKYVAYNRKRTVYRGTSNIKMYGMDINELSPNNGHLSTNTLSRFSEKLFMIGNKSFHFLSTSNTFKIEDVGDPVFEEIFNRLNRIITGQSRNRECIINTFLSQNEEIKNFFSSEEKKKDFLRKTRDLKKEEKRLVKDCFIALLHAFHYDQFPNCYMLSTSKEFNVTQKFIKGKGYDKKGTEGIVIISWIPKSQKGKDIKSIDLNRANEKVAQLGFPTYQSSPYPDEKEICIKAGILPHFMLGYILTKEKKFVINPYLISQIQNPENIKSILNSGLEINQSHFKDILNDTEYKIYFTSLGGDYRDHEGTTQP